jgi:hypothetical protein
MIGSQTPRLVVRFAQTYKCIYLLAILANFAIMAHDVSADWPSGQYLISATVFFANVISWWFFRKGTFSGYVIERALSVGRMAMCCAVVSFVLMFSIMYSPIAEVFWSHTLSLMGHLPNEYRIPFLWIVCFSLLGLEILYFRSIREMHQQTWAPQIDQPARSVHGS